MVASGWRARRRSRWRRFNPLHCGAVVASSLWGREPFRASVRLNPLHCGAVVASHQANRRRFADCRGVSIPFIAGQWSLRLAEGAWPGRVVFQSPSLRGSGRFMNYAALAARAHVRVSIPFIAGQWSLPPAQTRQSFRPPHVSIPFIAGQWSLLEHYFIHTPVVMPFQSPSLRGSGRFPRPRPPKADGGRRFQSPSLRGSGRFATPLPGNALKSPVSIPFIAGQWSLQGMR